MFLEPKAYDFAQRILKIYYEKDISKEDNNSEKTEIKNLLISELNDPKRQIGNTNYQKFEQIAKMIEKNEKIEKEEKKKN